MTSSASNNINIPDENGFTQLHHAADKGDLAEVKRLHQAGADLNAKGQGGLRAIHAATTKHHFEVLDYLVNNGAALRINELEEDLKMQLSTSIKYLPPEILQLISTAHKADSIIQEGADMPVIGDIDHTE